MRIDVHAHCFPAAFLDAVRAAGVDPGYVAGLGGGDDDASLDARLRLMDEAGVDRQVLSLSASVPDLTDLGALSDLTRRANDLLGAVVERDPDRFLAFAVVPMTDVEAAIAGLDDAMARPGVVGLAVNTAVAGRSIADAAFDPLFAELDRRGTLLFIHPVGRAAESDLVRRLGFEWLVGAPLEDTIAVTHLIARGVPSRYPRLRIVNAHLGGAVPVILARLDALLPRAVPDAPEPPSVAARRMWYDTVAHGHRPAVLAAADSFGPDRLLLGTDFPYVRGEHYRAAVDVVATAPFDREVIDGVLGRTAAALTGIG
jgi:aminocarboxymuconate-semialdehyde decarboxylase